MSRDHAIDALSLSVLKTAVSFFFIKKNINIHKKTQFINNYYHQNHTISWHPSFNRSWPTPANCCAVRTIKRRAGTLACTGRAMTWQSTLIRASFNRRCNASMLCGRTSLFLPRFRSHQQKHCCYVVAVLLVLPMCLRRRATVGHRFDNHLDYWAELQPIGNTFDFFFQIIIFHSSHYKLVLFW